MTFVSAIFIFLILPLLLLLLISASAAIAAVASPVEELFLIEKAPRQTFSNDFCGVTLVQNITRNALSCTSRLKNVCAAFSSTLLVLKLNPTRLLWLDALLRFYSAGFQHIAVYTAQRPGSPSDWLLVGQYDFPVKVLDDNLGFCDHQTVADAMHSYPKFDSYIFLSDDVLFQFWRARAFNPLRMWRQLPTKSTLPKSNRTDAAIAAVLEAYPDLASVIDAKLKSPSLRGFFAATSGIYHVHAPLSTVAGRDDRLRFQRISSILRQHGTYNEFGTPFLLECLDRGSYVVLQGKLVWGKKRLLAVSIPPPANQKPPDQLVFMHPVRASSELFARAAHFLFTRLTELDAAPHIGITSDALFFSSSSAAVMDCATHKQSLRKVKGLLHSCAVAGPSASCDGVKGAADNGQGSADQVATLWKAMSGKHVAKLVAGRFCVSSPQRDQAACEVELEHEGFWNAKIYREIFEQHYAMINKTRMRSKSWTAYPDCCVL